MRIDTGIFGQRFLSISLALAAVAGLSASSVAQNPTLIPATVKLVAGGGTTNTASGGTCPVSGYKATDAYGDGCLATEIRLGNVAAGATTPGARAAVADSKGNIFFTDAVAGLVRRIDVSTGIVTAVAGGATASPAAGTACGTGIAVDAHGDGCAANLVQLGTPFALTFASNGDLYFSDTGQANVRKIAATNGFITTTGTITNVAGTTSGTTYGYVVSNSTTTIIAATQSYLDVPAALAFDSKGDLFIAEQYKNAIFVVNTNATGSNTVNGVPVAAGTIWKIAGATYPTPQADNSCPNGTSGTFGCGFNPYVENAQANASNLDNPYGLAVDSTGNVYFSNEFYYVLLGISPTGVLTTAAGKNNTLGVQANTIRGTGTNYALGNLYGVAIDAADDVYFTDAGNGLIFRMDAVTKTVYPIAGGASTVCSAGDSAGNGCPGLQAKFYSTTTAKSANTLPGPGLISISADANYNVFVADTENNVIREVASGTQFGIVGATPAANTLIVHYGVGDGPASATPYAITTGSTLFKVGTPGACTSNTDGTMDCAVPVQPTPLTAGAMAGVLTVSSKLGKTSTFALSATYVVSRVTRTVVTFNPGATCTGSTTYSSAAQIAVTATVTATGTATGTVQFYNNLTTPIGSPVTLVGGVATLTQAFPAGSYSITAVYSGDTNFNTSTATTAVTFTTAAQSFSLSATTGQLATVPQGGTALYSFNVPQNTFNGTITFSCAGLPANSTCIFSPAKLTGTGCTLTGTSSPLVALSIVTSVKQSVINAGFGGRWMMFAGFFLALGLGLTRRRMSTRFAQISIALALLVATSGLVACSTSSIGNPSTPKGTSTITVTGAGSDGTVASTTVTLTVQ